MKRNIGSAERILRMALGVAVLSLSLLLEGDTRWFGLIGLIPIFTGAVGWCPLYSAVVMAKN